MHVMVLPIARPLILPDEAGFLLNARRLATGSAPSGLDYFPGYSVLIAPLTAISTDLHTLTRLVQVANGVLGIATALLAMMLARRLAPALSEPTIATIGIVVAAYPAYRLFAAFALSENVLVPWTVLLCLAFERAVRRLTVTDALLFGVLAGLALSIHTRALALPVAAVLGSLVLMRGRILAAAGAGITMGLAVAVGLVRYTLETPVETGASRTSPSSMVDDALSPNGVLDVIASAGGQIFYLLVATAGLAGLGMWSFIDANRAGARRANAINGPRDCSTQAIGLLAGLIFVGSLGISSLFLAGREGDFAIYGRYGEGVLVPFVVAGLTSLATDAAKTTARVRRLMVFVPVLAAALVIVRGPEAFQGRTLLLNIAGVFPVVDTVGSIRLSTITLFGVCFMLGVSLMLRWRFEAGGLLLASVFLAIGMFSIDRSAAAIDVLDQQDQLLPELVALSDDVACVALDIWQLPDRWHQENYRLSLNDQSFEYWSSATSEPPCSDLVLSQRSDLDDVIPGATVIAVEPFGRQALWVLPGALQDAIDATNNPTIVAPLDPLPPEQQATITLEVDATVLDLGTPLDIRVSVENLGPLGFFPQDGFAGVAGSVNLGLEFELVDAPGVRRQEPFRVRFPAALGPGEQVTLSQALTPEQIDPALQPGQYILVASLVQEGIGWTQLSDAITVEVRG